MEKIKCNDIKYNPLPLWDIVNSSHIISEHFLKTWAPPELFKMLQVGDSLVLRSKGSLKVESAVLPPVSSVAEMPDDATAIAILPVYF